MSHINWLFVVSSCILLFLFLWDWRKPVEDKTISFSYSTGSVKMLTCRMLKKALTFIWYISIDSHVGYADPSSNVDTGLPWGGFEYSKKWSEVHVIILLL